MNGRDGPKPGFVGIMGHKVMHPHGIPGVYWRRNIRKVRRLTAEYARRGRNA